MGEIDIQEGYRFVRSIERLDSVRTISILDRRKDGTEFKVNGWNAFADTIQADQPNYVSYATVAKHLGVDRDSLLSALKAFTGMKVNEFERCNGYDKFRVMVGFGPDRGYLYCAPGRCTIKDTLFDKWGRLALVKQLDGSWFEYLGVR